MPNALKKWPPHWPVIVPLAVSGTNQAFAGHWLGWGHQRKRPRNTRSHQDLCLCFRCFRESHQSWTHWCQTGTGDEFQLLWFDRTVAPCDMENSPWGICCGDIYICGCVNREQFDGDPSVQCMLMVMHGRIGSCFEECSKSSTRMAKCMNTPCPTVLSLRLTCNIDLQLEQHFDPRAQKWKRGFHCSLHQVFIKNTTLHQVTTDWTWNWKIEKLPFFIPNAKFCDHSDPSLIFWSPVQSHHIRQMAARQAKEPQVACWIYHDLNMRTPNLSGEKTPQSSRF